MRFCSIDQLATTAIKLLSNACSIGSDKNIPVFGVVIVASSASNMYCSCLRSDEDGTMLARITLGGPAL